MCSPIATEATGLSPQNDSIGWTDCRDPFRGALYNRATESPVGTMTPANELLSREGKPRSLRCCDLTLGQLARQHQMTLEGADREIARFATLSALADREGLALTYLSSAPFANLLREGDVAVITRAELRGCLREGNVAVIVDGDPHDWFYTAFASAVENGNYEKLAPFVSHNAKIHPMAVIGENVHIEAGAVIGPGAVVLPNTYVGADVVIKPNATVGGDGYENAVVRGRRTIVPHAGGVWLCEGVQVGSSTCIDRGLFGDFSFVGPYTTMDNLVHVAHSVRMGRNCSLTACSEISGAAVLGDGVWLGPNSSVNQGRTLGDHCYLGTGAVVTKDLLPHSLALGSPARVMAHACVCRAKLQFENGRATCATCSKEYRQGTDGLVQRV